MAPIVWTVVAKIALPALLRGVSSARPQAAEAMEEASSLSSSLSAIQHTQRFTSRPATECGSLLAEQSNGGRYRRITPVIKGPVVCWIADLMKPHLTEEVVPPPAQVVRLRDATVTGVGTIVIDGSTIVRESLINAHHAKDIDDFVLTDEAGLYEAKPDYRGSEPLPDGTYVLLKQRWDSNYGHWLVESLPRLSLLEGLVDLTRCRFLLTAAAPAMRKVYADSLAAYGITEEQLVWPGPRPQFVKDLIYPLPLTVQPWVKAPVVITALEELGRRLLATATPAPQPEKLYVRRPDGARRKLRNEDAVLRMVEQRGYVVTTPGLMSLAAQVQTFSRASHIVGVLGAECTNLAFSPRGIRFLGLAPEHMQDDFFYDLCSHKKGQYFCLHGTSDNPSEGFASSFEVDLQLFTQMLEDHEAG
ncbi:glycosyltransferase family 61 protein [Roseicella frigidaeris]|nr:glycosyltransferase family 61 protein [Roseicella frigidaeris]